MLSSKSLVRSLRKWFTTGYIPKENVSYKPLEVEYTALSQRANDKDTKQNVKDVLLARLQDPNVFGQSILWDRDNNSGRGDAYDEGIADEEEADPTDTDSDREPLVILLYKLLFLGESSANCARTPGTH
ncbi:MAG: hypothetical protein WDO15_29840 [Bacteroidota bacterium]